METVPKSLRLQVAITGRVNAGKSTLLNLISGQSSAITSPERGTTTDVVEKVMELRPLGPVVLLDTAGVDDESILGKARFERTLRAVDRADIMLIVTRTGVWGDDEKYLLELAQQRKIPFLVVVNRQADEPESAEFAAELCRITGEQPLFADALNECRDDFLTRLTGRLLPLLPDEAVRPPALLHDLVAPGSLIVMMVPIDLQAPKGRLIMPQVQAIRDALDGDCQCLVAKESAFPEVLDKLVAPPDLVVCDSQVVDVMVKVIPAEVQCTTFSILMARMKGDLEQFSRGVAALQTLRPGDRILVAESCTHHASDDDIGRKKIPAMLAGKIGGALQVDIFAGADFPADVGRYKMVLHCGGCMLNRRAMLNRLNMLDAAGVPVVNYGMCISYCKGVLERVLSPFPEALKQIS